jgi:RNA polymerase sigma-70 factor, ECF subfamily
MTAEMDLAAVLRRCLATGDRADWEGFMELTQPLVAAGVLRGLGRFGSPQRELADDLVQETFLKLCSNSFRILRAFRGDNGLALQVYLKTIAASVVVDHLRASSAQKKGEGKRPANIDDVAPFLAVDDQQFAEFERRAMLERVEECLEGQEERNRTIFWLYHRQGLTPKAIASLGGIGMSSDGVETALYRLTRAVRDCVKRAMTRRAAAIPEGGRP